MNIPSPDARTDGREQYGRSGGGTDEGTDGDGADKQQGEMYKGTHGSEGTDKIVGRGSDGATAELTSDNSVTDTTEEGRGKDGQVRPYVPVQGGVGRVRRNDDGK